MDHRHMNRTLRKTAPCTKKGTSAGSYYRAFLETLAKYPDYAEKILHVIHTDVILCTKDFRIAWSNNATLAKSSLVPDEQPAQKCHEAVYGNPVPCANCPVRMSFTSGKPETASIKTPGGRFFEVQTLPLLDAEGAVEQVLEFAHDVTEQVALHEEAIRTNHVSSLDALSAGIAHEINNPINGIINYAQMLANRHSQTSDAGALAGRIIVEGERIAGIVQSLLTFSGQDSPERKKISLHDLLADCLALIQTQLKDDGIHLRLDIKPDLPEILVHGKQMRQVFLNLISNARHALNTRFPEAHSHKVLTISGRAIHLESGTLLQVEFHDQGTGIAPETMGNIFIPFFTTKAGRNGVGLGLSTSRNILTQHNGTIRVDSNFGKYTKVTIEIPVAESRTTLSAKNASQITTDNNSLEPI